MGTIYSTEKKKLMESLTDEEIKTLAKDNPFKKERNASIRELCHRGVSRTLLAQVVGLSSTSIEKIINTGVKGQISKIQTISEVDIEKLRGALVSLCEEFVKILQAEGGEKGEFKQR